MFEKIRSGLWKHGKNRDNLGLYYYLEDFQKFSIHIDEYLNQIRLNELNFPFEINPSLYLNLTDDLNLNKIYNSGLNSAFEEILYLFLFCKNYSHKYNKERVFRIFHILLIRGKGTLGSLKETTFFKSEDAYTREEWLENHINTLNNERKNITDACPFSKVSKELKNSFFNKVWNYIENIYFPAIEQSGLRISNNLDQYEISFSRNRKEFRKLLFQLGLLGKYERGELEV